MILFFKNFFTKQHNISSRCLLVFCLLFTVFSFSNIIAATPADIATEKIQVRKPSDEKIEDFRNQRDFSYTHSLKPAESMWARFWRWLGYQIGKLLEKTSYDYFWKPLLYCVLIATVIFVIMKLFGVEIRSLFTKAPSSVTIPYDVVEENIHEINLDELIIQATERKNYRLAVRYLYLKILKQLNDSGNIEWKPGKTNRMYLSELNKNNLYKPFEYLTTQFEFIWYGEFEVNDYSYQNVKEKFTSFGNGIPN